MGNSGKRVRKKKLSEHDIRFLFGTGIFRSLPVEAEKHLLASMAPISVRAGERFIQQGDPGDCLFLIQEGSCWVIVETDGKEVPVARRRAGDLIGEMAIVTGEERAAHVDAETDLTLWRMGRFEFDELSRTYPDIRAFVTEIVTSRLSRSKVTAQKKIGKYLITDVIAEGGWSIVYKGIHSSLHLPVAVKMLKHTMAMDPDFSRKFQNEAKVIARLDHPNIVRVYDIEHMYRTIFIVMEYLTGFTLSQILGTVVNLDFPRVLNLLMQVSDGLAYAHKRGIVHQDVKPANIFVQKGDRARIVDFGIACPVGTGEEIEFVGTAHYMAPEQITADVIDERTDVYALGITAFELATGRKPFQGLDVNKVLKAQRQSPVPDPCTLNPELPSEFNSFIQRATQKDPSLRYQTMDEVYEDLRRLADICPAGRSAEADPGLERAVLVLPDSDADRLELKRVLEDFGERLKELGIELSVWDSPPSRGPETGSKPENS
ncbi:MAG: protein kinase [Thermodesulfobacteriota bacterium]